MQIKRILPIVLFVTFCLIGFSVITQAQDANPNIPDYGVWVTTQDRSWLRSGPGFNWDQLVVIPHGTTLRVTGRTAAGDWIQVAYEGTLNEGVTDEATIDGVTYGWIRYWLLVWTGDILEVPVDGIPTVRIARRANTTIEIGPETLYYVDGIDPSTRVIDTVDGPVEVEITGRVGSPVAGYFWIQFRIGDQYYWTGTWEVGVPDGYFLTLDGAYIYPYGRLLQQLRTEINRNGNLLNSITRHWRDLDAGQSTTCNNIPRRPGLNPDYFPNSDLQREPEYIPALRALKTAIEFTDSAIAAFEEVCSREGADRFVAPEEVRDALVDVEEANRYFALARTLLNPLARRDPLLGNVD